MKDVFEPAGNLDVVAPPFRHNPSSWAQRVPICILAAIAAVIAAWMGLYQWRLIDGVWDPVFGNASSEYVLDSPVAKTMHSWFRIPDAIFGSFAYLGDVVFGLAGSTRRWQYRPWIVILFGIDVIPLGIVSAILVFTQGAVLQVWCFPCIVTAIISLVLVYFAYDEVWASLCYLWRVWKRTGDWKLVWDTFWGRPSQVAAEVALERR